MDASAAAVARGMSAAAAADASREVRCRSVSLDAYNAMVGALADAAMPEDAKAVLLEMDASGMRPDSKTFSMLISAYGRRGRSREARALFQLAQEGELADHVETVNAVLGAYREADAVSSSLSSSSSKGGNPMFTPGLDADVRARGRSTSGGRVIETLGDGDESPQVGRQRLSSD